MKQWKWDPVQIITCALYQITVLVQRSTKLIIIMASDLVDRADHKSVSNA